jgi:hypothetical protein
MMLLLLAASLTCPVLNLATARGVLGEVQLSVSHNTCRFTSSDSELTIEIGTLAAPSQFAHFAETACQGGRDVTLLKAIGNEAVACGVQTSETVVGRVRNQTFIIRLAAPNTKSLRNKTTALAEQVAGNLF